MRIIGGKFKGRQLATPKDDSIRPTSDRLRETIFNTLIHGIDTELENSRILDLFAGTGSLGFEALSRGAGHCLFVDSAVEARALIRTNIERFELMGQAKIFRRDATKLGSAGTIPPFNIIFVDPPYGRGMVELALGSAVDGNWLCPNSVCVLEEYADGEIKLPSQFKFLTSKRTGGSQVQFWQLRD